MGAPVSERTALAALLARFQPIEEFFAELKAYIKESWSAYEANPDQGFHVFLRRCVHDVGAKRQSAEVIFDMQV